jgi:excisionase family DNA binding protein
MSLISAGDLQKELGISRSTLYRWRKEGMPHKKMGHKTIRYDLAEVMKWLEERN